MPVPPGFTVFQWMRKQGFDLNRTTNRFETFYTFWAQLTTGQKTTLKNVTLADLDTIIAEVTDTRNDLAAL